MAPASVSFFLSNGGNEAVVSHPSLECQAAGGSHPFSNESHELTDFSSLCSNIGKQCKETLLLLKEATICRSIFV